MKDPNEELNEQQAESTFGQSDPELEIENAGFGNRAVTGGKGPGLVSEGDSE